VIGVLNDILKDKTYLVEDKLSYADLAFVNWFTLLDRLGEAVHGWKEEEKFAAVRDWLERLTERDSFKKLQGIQEESAKGKEGVYNLEA
jgi:glutathione S-transferase